MRDDACRHENNSNTSVVIPIQTPPKAPVHVLIKLGM